MSPTTPPPLVLDHASAPVPALSAYDHTLLGRFDRRFLAHPAARRGAAALFAALIILPSIQFIRDIPNIDRSLFRDSGTRHKTALGRWIPSAQLLAQGDPSANPYAEGHWFPTPPLVLLCLVPLAKLGYIGAAVAWSILKAAGLLISLRLLLREIGRDRFAVPLGVVLITALFAARPVVSDIQHGNLNIFMLVWIALAWTSYLRRSDALAGIFLALAIVTKITPALLLVYFLYKRQWRVTLFTLLGLVLFVLIVPSLFLGFSRNLHLLQTWFDMIVAPFALHGYAAFEIANQSLYGVLLRILSNAGLLSIEHMPTELAWSVGMEDMARPATALGRLIRPAISLSILALLAWSCRARTDDRRNPRLFLEFALVLLAMLLLGERTWKHHATTLPIIYLAIWYALTCLHWSDKFRAAFVAGLFAQWFLLMGTSEGLVGENLADRLMDGGFFAWGLLLCLLQTAWMLRGLSRREFAAPMPRA